MTEMTEVRRAILDRLADELACLSKGHPVRVAIDGRTASGKTTLANELALFIEECGRPVIRTSIDGFHKPKIERYARGRYSPEGYYYDARDLRAIRSMLLDPLGPGGSGIYRTASFDLEQDRPIEQEPQKASANAIVIVDGTFLQRPELEAGWDATIYVKVSEGEAERRGMMRDAVLLGGHEAAGQLYASRYRPAFALYEKACDPEERADAIVDNEELARPGLLFRTGARLDRS